MENLTEDFAAVLGIDWSDEKRDVCLLDASTGKQQQRSILKHPPEAGKHAELLGVVKAERKQHCEQAGENRLVWGSLS